MTGIHFRCDASLLMGSGHVMRCRNLARELKKRGAEITFVCRRQPGDLINLLEREFRVETLPEQPQRECEGLVGRKLYEAWLGCTQDKDAKETITAIESIANYEVNWLIVDHYGLDANWEKQVVKQLQAKMNKRVRLFAIDDLADRSHHADVLLDQNFFGNSTESRYQDFIPGVCIKLLGPCYALLSDEYALLHNLVTERTELQRVLVSFGGVDPCNYTSLVLMALSIGDFRNLAVDVVLGWHSPHIASVKELVSKRQKTTLHSSLLSLAALIARADLVIGAGGIMTWERICLKVNSIIIPFSENQVSPSLCIDDLGGNRVFSNVNDSIKFLHDILREDEFPFSLNSKSLPSIDGKGVERVAELLLSL